MGSELIKRVGLVLGSLVLAEALVHAIASSSVTVRSALAPPWERNSRWLDDTRLRLRSNPLWREHDANGYRNAQTLRRADIVALGDSQTYGSFVARDAAWPRVLSARTGLSVYNMGVGGYGPGQYLLQIDDALRLSPKLVIVAIYLGNDFQDAFILAQRQSAILALAPPATRSAATSLEIENDVYVDKHDMWGRSRCTQEATPRLFVARKPPARTEQWLQQNVMLYGLVRGLLHTTWQSQLVEQTAAAFATVADRCAEFIGHEWRTVFNVPNLAMAVDDHDAGIRLGFEISRAALHRIQQSTQAAGANLLVVLLPTKASVFWPRVAASASRDQAHPGYAELATLVANEARLRRHLTAELRSDDVTVLDVLQALGQSLRQPYFENSDEHLNEVGHDVVAGAIEKWLEAQKEGASGRVWVRECCI